MTAQEIERVVRSNLGNTIEVTAQDGQTALLFVQWVDDEGCTCRVTGHPDYDPAQVYWWAFSEISDARTSMREGRANE